MKRMLDELEGFYGLALAELYRVPANKGYGIVMGCPLWGEKYIERFAQYCLPTILAPKNQAALNGKCRMVLFTDKQSFGYLVGLLENLERDHGIQVLLHLIPDELIKRLGDDPMNKYWVLGVAGGVLLKTAARANMGFHMLLPDHCYGPAYFENLFRLSSDHEVIVQPGISASIETAAPELEKYRDGITLPVPDRDLGDIGFRHLHKQTASRLMNGATLPDDLPESHLLIWQGKDSLHVYCPHMNAAYLSPRICALAPSRIPATLDAELPAIIAGNAPFYVPKVSDGMTYIELSDAKKGDIAGRTDLEGWLEHSLIRVRFSDAWMPYFNTCYEVPIHNQELPEPNVYLPSPLRQKKTWVDRSDIQIQQAALSEALAEQLRPSIANRFISNLGYNR